MKFITIPPDEQLVRDLYSEMAQYLVVVGCELQGRSYLFQNPHHHSQHHLAKLSPSEHKPHLSAASRPCCRSLLTASSYQLSGDDVLSH